MPAVLAATALMGIVGFIVCAILTWVLFQKRTDLAIRTLEGAYIPQLEQSLLDPDTKSAVLGEIEQVIDDLEAGRYENWQAAGIMQRLQRLPVFQWGELQAVEAFLQNASNDTFTAAERTAGRKQLSRLRRAVEMEKVFSFDFKDVLEPVRRPSNASPSGFELVRPLPPDGVRESIRRAKLLADRSGIPDETFEEIRIEQILEREIERGSSAGTY
jgi:hypothetical protein